MAGIGHQDRYAMLIGDELHHALTTGKFSHETWVGTYHYSSEDGELILIERPNDGDPITHVIIQTKNISGAIGEMRNDFIERQPMEDYYTPSGMDGCRAITLAVLLAIWAVTGLFALLTTLF